MGQEGFISGKGENAPDWLRGAANQGQGNSIIRVPGSKAIEDSFVISFAELGGLPALRWQAASVSASSILIFWAWPATDQSAVSGYH